MTIDPRMAAFTKLKQAQQNNHTAAAPKSALQSAFPKSGSTVSEDQTDATDNVTIDQSLIDNAASGNEQYTGPGAKLITITKKLTAIIKEETTYLREHKTQVAASLHGEKTRLMAEYKKTLNHIQLNEHLLGPKDSSMRKFIRTLTDAFRDALKEHARIVLRMKSISEGIIKSIGEEVTKRTKPVLSYGANAAMRGPTTPQATSLSLNQVI